MEGMQEGPPEPQPRQLPPRQQRSVRQRPSSRRAGGVDRVRDVEFPLVLRGYDRAAVDAHLGQLAQLVAELEATQLRENVVQKALDEVGEETSSILQHAHETAEEITGRSRSQAEARIRRAEREAEMIRREAQQYAERVASDTQRLTEDRRRLIEELRQFAEDVLGVADDALERLPELLADRPGDDPQALEADSEPTTEQLPGSPEREPTSPPPESEPEPEPEPTQASPRPPEPAFEGDDGISEGILKVERRPKGGSK